MNFIFKGRLLEVPKVASNGLLLYYDMKGKTNESKFKELVFDTSGQGRNGELQNFAFTDRSGYNKGLNFDGVDDRLKLSPMSLTPTSFTVQMNDVILAYDGADVRRVVKNRIVSEKSGVSGIPTGASITSLSTLDGNILSDLSDELETTVRDVQTGNPVFSDKADEGAVVHVEVGGISKQETAPAGANLIDLPSTPTLFGNAALNGYGGAVGWSAIPNGIKLTGMWNAVGWKIPLPVNTVVTLSADVAFKGGTAASELTVGVNVESGTTSYGDYYDLVPGTTRQAITFTTHATKADNVLGFASNEAGAGSVEITNVQIELGAINTPYAPVTPPMPSPTRPGAIKSLNKSFDIVSSNVSGKNLLTFMELGGVQWTTGTDLDLTDRVRSTYIPVALGDTLSFSIDGTGFAVSFYEYDINKQPLNPVNRSARTYTTINEGVRFLRVIHTNNGDTSLKFQLEKGSVVTPYEPASTSSNMNKTNILLSEPLRSVGDVKDRLFLDTDGLWKVERNVGEYTFTGDQEWILETNRDDWLGFYTRKVSSVIKRESNTNGLCSHFNVVSQTAITANARNVEGVNIHNVYGVIRFGVYPAIIGATNEMDKGRKIALFRDWIDWSKVVIQYELATPTIETLPQSEQVKLNNIQSFKGSNYVYTVANLTPNLTATFKPIFWYKNRLVLNQVKFWNRPLSDEELLSEYRLSKERYSI